MGYITLFFCVLFSVYSYLRLKYVYSPSFLFNLLFLIITSLSLTQYDSAPIPKDYIYFIVLLGVLSYNVGCELALKIKQIVSSYENISKKKYRILIFISLVMSYFPIHTSIDIIIKGGNLLSIYQERIKAVYVDGVMDTSSMESQIINFISLPLCVLCIYTSLALFIRYSHFKYFVISIIFILIFTLSTAGRMTAVSFLLVFVIAFYTKNKSNILYFLKNRKNILLIIIIILITFKVLSSRNTDIFKTINTYYGYPLIHMQIKLEMLDKNIMTYGLTSLQGILRPIILVLHFIGINDLSLFDYATSTQYLANSAVFIGYNHNAYNTFVTLFYYFFIDFGYLGVCIFSMIFGYICGRSFKLWKLTNKIYYEIQYYIILSSPILFSMVRFQFINATYLYPLILLPFIMKKEKNN